MLIEKTCSFLISFYHLRIVMYLPIDFDCKLLHRTIKVQYVLPNTELPSEFGAKLFISKTLPYSTLR